MAAFDPAKILGEFDACVLVGASNRFFCTGLDTSFGCVVLTQKERWFLTDARYTNAAVAALGDTWNVKTIGFSALHESVKDILRGACVSRVGLETETLTVAEYEAFREAIGSTEIVSCDATLSRVRAIKTDEEIALIAKSQQINEIALSRTLAAAKPRMTERDLCAEYSYQLLKAGADGYSFDPIVAGGKFTAEPHHKIGDYRIEKNDPILFDVGGKYRGYCSDMTRTVCLGEPSKELRNMYALVLEAQTYALSKIKAGMTCHDADSLAREYFAANGVGELFGHSLGHGVGIDIHEFPRLGNRSETVLEPNMVVTVEPGIYKAGVGGVRIEDMIVIGEDGVRNLTSFHKKFAI